MFISRGRARTTAQPQSLAPVGTIRQQAVYGTDETNDRFGSAVALGDVNKDGRADAVIGGSGEALPGGPAAGAAVALLKPLVTAGPPAPPASAPEPTAASIVENYSYPGGATILEQQGIRLIRGNGRITLATCGDATDLIMVETLNDGVVCFRAERCRRAADRRDSRCLPHPGRRRRDHRDRHTRGHLGRVRGGAGGVGERHHRRRRPGRAPGDPSGMKGLDMKLLRLVLLTVLSGSLVLAVPTGASAQDPAMSPVVEDYAYPGGAAIEQEQGIKLIRGDGRITLSECEPRAVNRPPRIS